MSSVKFGGLLAKVMVASVIFTSIFSSTAQAMWFGHASLDKPSQEQTEWSKDNEQLEAWFSRQEYELLFQRLDYFFTHEQQEAYDWLQDKACENHDVSCMYELIRRNLKGTLFGEEPLSEMFELMVLSLVQTKADVDCCTLLSHKYKNPHYNPYDIIKDNYHHRLKSRKLLQQCSYDNIIKKAKTKFDNTIKKDPLPLPIWICTVDYGRKDTWVYFGDLNNLEWEREEREKLRTSYTLKQLVAEVKILREKSFANTWDMLLSLNGWDEFFELNASDFGALPDVSDLNSSEVHNPTNNSDAMLVETK